MLGKWEALHPCHFPLPELELPSEGTSVGGATEGAGAAEHQQESPARHSAPSFHASPGPCSLGSTEAFWLPEPFCFYTLLTQNGGSCALPGAEIYYLESDGKAASNKPPHGANLGG